MLTKRTVVVASVLVLALLAAAPVAAATVTVVGSLAITKGNGDPLGPTDLVGVAVIANPGFEKTITQHIPPYTFPVFVDGDNDETVSVPLTHRRFDTTVVLTNTSGASLTIKLTLRDSTGTVVAGPNNPKTVTFTLAFETQVIDVADLLP